MRVLIADDDPVSRMLLSRSLANWGHEVVEASDGLEAYEFLQHETLPEMMILDWMMPAIDGLALCRKLRAERSDAPYIIIVTAAGENGNIQRALGSGADDYIRKPFDLDELKARVDLGERTFRLHRNLMATCKAAEKSESRVRSLLDSAAEGIYGVNRDGLCTFINHSAASTLGFAPEELIGRCMHDAVHYRHADGAPFPRSECPLSAVIERGESHREAEVTLLRKDGSSFVARYSSSPLTEDGQVAGAVVAFNDITEERSVEEHLRQSAKLEAVGRLAGGVAHDFNNMLTVIHGYTELLLMRMATTDPLRRYAEAILNAAERSANLTQQLLAFSRRQVVKRELVDINSVVEGMQALLKQLVGEDIAMQNLLLAEAALVFADPGQLGQLVMNLAMNARDAMRGGGTLTIESANVTLGHDSSWAEGPVDAGAYVSLSVSDTGCGMDAETRTHIFEPFFTTKAKGEGTGLGLAMVYGIVKQNSGYIRVESEIGAGSTFTVYLPRSDAKSLRMRDLALATELSHEPVAAGHGGNGSR